MQYPPHFNPQWRGTVLCIPFFILLSNLVPPTLCSLQRVDRGQVRYWELQSMNASCYPRDSCREKREQDRSLLDHNYLCGKTCAAYDACCVDSAYSFDRPIERTISTCSSVYSRDWSYGVFMVDQCRPDYRGDPHISELCSGDAEKLNDPLIFLPVTNTKTGITYKNYFCAACNDDVNLRHSVFWAVSLTSFVNEISESELINMKFDPKVKSWILPNATSNEVDTIDVKLQIFEELFVDVKYCHLTVTSDCAEGWPDDVTKQKCAAYMALVVLPGKDGILTRFRNIHCAICNGVVKHNGVKCDVKPATPYGGGYKPPVSFALLLDVNRSDGDRVGVVQRCPEDQIYDPFFKKCRVLKCVRPGDVIKDGSCVKQ